MTRTRGRLARRTCAIVILTVVPAGIPAAAQEPDPCIDPVTQELVLTEEQVYVHQAGTKVGNLAALGQDEFPSWDGNRPQQSVTQGAGGGYLAPFGHFSLNQDETLMGLTIEGPQTGCLDTMLIELYAFLPTNRTSTSGDLQERAFTGLFNLDVDGQRILAGIEHETKTVPNPAGSVTYRIRLAITGLHQALGFAGVARDGEHRIRLNVNPRFANTTNALFVYDTTEVPSGILFNGTPDETYSVLPAS